MSDRKNGIKSRPVSCFSVANTEKRFGYDSNWIFFSSFPILLGTWVGPILKLHISHLHFQPPIFQLLGVFLSVSGRINVRKWRTSFELIPYLVVFVGIDPTSYCWSLTNELCFKIRLQSGNKEPRNRRSCIPIRRNESEEGAVIPEAKDVEIDRNYWCYRNSGTYNAPLRRKFSVANKRQRAPL